MFRQKLAVGGLAAGVVLASGCTTLGPDFEPPEPAKQEIWQESEDPQFKMDQSAQTQWWKVFNDPVLDGLIDEAYQQNIGLRAVGLRILQARANLGIRVGEQYPQTQQAAGSYSTNRISKNSPNFNPNGSDNDWQNLQYGFDVAWEMDFWGKFRRGIESADATLSVTIEDYRNALVTLTAEVASTYVAIRATERRIVLAKQNVKIQERSLRIATVRFRNGATTELDVQQALSNLKNTEAQVPQFEQDLRQFKNALAVLLGITPAELGGRLGESRPIPVVPAEVAVGVPAELLRRRPDVRSAELQAAAQSAQIGIAETALYPSFSLTSSIGYQAASTNQSSIDDIFQTDSLAYNFGPGFTWNILNYGRLKNNVRLQDAAFQELVETYKNTVLNAYKEVEDAMVGVVRSQEEVVFREQSVKAAARSAQLANIQYRDGAVDFQRVLDTERFLNDQEQRLTTNQADIPLALIEMYRALGGGWEISEGQEFVPAGIQEQMADRTDWGDILQREATEPEERDRLAW